MEHEAYEEMDLDKIVREAKVGKTADELKHAAEKGTPEEIYEFLRRFEEKDVLMEALKIRPMDALLDHYVQGEDHETAYIVAELIGHDPEYIMGDMMGKYRAEERYDKVMELAAYLKARGKETLMMPDE